MSKDDMSTNTQVSPTQLRVAIAGCGVIGRTHAAAVRELPELLVTALIDEVAEASEALAAWVEEDGTPRPAVRWARVGPAS